jgi:hypothetical protein
MAAHARLSREYPTMSNEAAKPFVQHKTADEILASVANSVSESQVHDTSVSHTLRRARGRSLSRAATIFASTPDPFQSVTHTGAARVP